MTKVKTPAPPVLTYIPLSPRHRRGFLSETSHELPHLTEPGLVSPLDKILKAQMQGMPVSFNAGHYLEQDFSVIDNLDSIELFEYRSNLTLEIEERQREFHAATKLLAEKQKAATQDTNSPSPDPKPTSDPKVSQKASKEAESSNNPS